MIQPEEIWEIKQLPKTNILPMRVKATCLTSAGKITRTYWPDATQIQDDLWHDWATEWFKKTREVVRIRGRKGVWYFMTWPSTKAVAPASTIQDVQAIDQKPSIPSKSSSPEDIGNDQPQLTPESP